MDTKALRQKILDLAIRGKLVPQDPNDEPASVLLERIRAEKQQMVKDGKLKAKDIKNDTVIFKGDDNLHYEQFQDGTVKCIEDEIPFELPDGWAWARLGVICPYGENKAVSADLIDETAWILDLEDIEKETGVIKKYTTKSERNSVSNKYSFCKGQLLYISEIKEWRGTATQLITQVNETEVTPNVVTKILARFSSEVFQPQGIEYKTKRTGTSRLIYLKKNDGNDGDDNKSAI